MELTREQILKHRDQIEKVLDEVTVKSFQKHSKKGTIFTVKQHERDVIKKAGDAAEKLAAKNGGDMLDRIAARADAERKAETMLKVQARGEKMRQMDSVKAELKAKGPDPMSPGQLKKKHGKDIFAGAKSIDMMPYLKKNPDFAKSLFKSGIVKFEKK